MATCPAPTIESPDEPEENSQQAGILTKTTPADLGLVKLPILTPHLQFHDIGNQQILLVSEFFNTLLQGKLYCDLIPLLTGNNTLDEIISTLKSKYNFTSLLTAIATLSAKGYVISAEYNLVPTEAAYWSSLGASPRWVEQRFVETSVSVKGDQGQLVQNLTDSNISVQPDATELTVIFSDDFLAEDLFSLNQHFLERGIRWMLVRPQGIEPLFGPIFHADKLGPCWACLSYRLRNHQEVHNFLRHRGGGATAVKPIATDSTTLRTIIGVITNEIVKWLVLDELAPLHQHAITMNFGSLTLTKHSVVRRPQCSECGDAGMYIASRTPVPITLRSSPKTHCSSGGVHTVRPEITLAKYQHLISPVSGVVSWLKRTTEETDTWLHVYWAGSNLGARGRSLSSLRRSLRSKSAGKGSTREQSQVSALCEAIERYSGSYQGGEIYIRKTFNEFATGDEAIHPNAVQLFSKYQFENVQKLNAQGHPYNIIPQPLDESATINWTPVWSFTQRRHRYIPTTMLYTVPAELREPNDLIADSNGCAAGNTLEEAILQGFYELVERDAFAIWWYNRLQVPEVDLTSFDDEYLSAATAYYNQNGRDLWVLDVTSDIGLPSFVALSRRPDAETEDIIYGAGTHSEPRIAALRAVCELNQCLSWVPNPQKVQGRPTIDNPLALRWWKTARLNDCTWLEPFGPVRKAADYNVKETTDIRDDLEDCRARVEDKGLEFLVLDQTRPDIKMPVVRVIVPGLRHFWARFAPGRLFDVPVKMGLRDHGLNENELNQTPVIA